MKHGHHRCMAVVLIALAGGAHAGEWSGSATFEYRAFAREPLFAEQAHNDYSFALQPEYAHTFEGSKHSLRFIGFARADRYDENRTHADIRELAYLHVGDDYEWRLGIRKVFWGVTEAQHLVDVVNQTDLVENFDTEDKLGQPMVNLALIRDWGTLDLFVLPYFRDRTFPAAEGRWRTALPVDSGQAQYESSRGRRHVDYTARWSHSWSGIDFGLSHFVGTSRDPRFTLGVNNDGEPVLVPNYDQLRQSGLDVAASAGAWLWKLEAVHRHSNGASYAASTAGFEYTLSGVFDSGADLGLLAEYMYDDRGDEASSPFQDDYLLGLRLALNDEPGTELLLGMVRDRHTGARFTSIEASRRLGGGWKLLLEARAFADIPLDDPLYSLSRDDYLLLELAWYY